VKTQLFLNVKTLRGTVKLVLRNGIGLVIPTDFDLELEEADKYGLVFSSSLGRSSSVFAEIKDIKKDGEKVLIYLDKRIAGEIGDGEKVEILISSAPPRAEMVYLAVPDTVHIPGGDWTKIVREGNIGKTIDYGNKLSFVVPSTLRDPYVVQAQIISSLPYPPALIYEGTKFKILKKKKDEFSQLLVDAYIKRKSRAIELLEGLKNGYYDALMELKNNKLESLGRSVQFYSAPEVAFEAIKTIFTSYQTVQEKVTVNTETNYVASLMVVANPNTKDMHIIEVVASGKEKSGTIAIWIYGAEVDRIYDKLHKEILPKINQLIEGVKEGPELIPMYCAGNCGELLDLKDIDENGIIECPACGTLNMIPPRLRIH